jgi:hypothetical protein
MRISIRRAIATLGMCALSTPLVAADYGYNQPTRLPAVNVGVHQAGYYSTSPYRTASADVESMPTAGAPSNIVIQGDQYGSSHAMPAGRSSYSSGCGSYDVGGCDSGVMGIGDGCGVCCSPWFASAAGLYFDRDDANEIWLSYDDADIASRTLGTKAAEMDWSGGGEITFGRYFNCGMNAVAVTYWGIYSDAQTVSVFGADQAGNLDTSLNYNSVAYDDGGGASAVNDWYDDAQVHRLRRDYEFHNVELNLLGSACAVPLQSANCGCGNSLQMSWLAGIRFFKFDEDFQFASDDTNTTFTGEVDELYHNIDVQNNLIGFQLGANAEYATSSRLSLTSGLKFGVYGNYMENHQSIVGGTGTFATIDNVVSPYDGLEYDFHGDKTRVSFLGEVDLGIRYQATRNWSIRSGYRALAVSGVALSINQFPGNFNFEDAAGAGDVETNGSLILHGGYLGAEYNY